MQHLLMRGENPDAIRIVDMNPPTRKDTIDKVDYVKADVSDVNTVKSAFQKTWPKSTTALPLTVFHCVAYINVRDRHPDMLAPYLKVIVQGTENVLETARQSGATCFITTSSASVALRPPSYFPYPWQRWPKDIYQLVPNADVSSYSSPLEEFAGCYAWTKMKAEDIVLKANSPAFLTGTIRPGHAIYGHGANNPSSFTYDYLRRGGSPSWIAYLSANFVNAQNVSIGHLAYEDAVLKKGHPGGKGYCVTDPDPPIVYREVYKLMEVLAHPSTPLTFKYISFVILLLMSYPIEQYLLLRHRRLSWLPALPEEMTYLQPALFNCCTLHIVYTDTAAQEEVNYRAPIHSLEGFALAVLDWNDEVETKLKAANKQ